MRVASGCARCWFCSAPAREAGPAAVRAGIAVELVHMASLVHDDVLDRAPLRRGLPTVYASSGRDRATALGDRLFSTAFKVLVDGGDAGAVREVSATAVDLARGELRQREGAFDLDLTEGDYFDRCALKTGRLFEAACVLGRASTGGDPGPVGPFGQKSVSPSSCSTTRSTSPVRRSAPARPGAPTCWTARSRCR
ncbi:MAG: polyprenyl synthetase family protein [Piscinibacter sp.]